jgi:pimeloyl-ACP methyl ester carboxylesterase
MESIIIKLHVDSGVQLPGEGALQLGAEVWAPNDLDRSSPVTAFVCLPGGGMTRRYFDLPVENDETFSFARQMVERGFVVILIDHLGVSESTRPADGYAVTAEIVAKANAHVTEQIAGKLRAGSLSPSLPALQNLRTIGVGHSMGAMMTLLQQAQYRQHAAIALLGFSTRGLPEYMPPQVRELAADPVAVRAKLASLARAMFVQPYPVIKPTPQSGGIFAGKSADPRGAAAIKQVSDVLLPICAFLSMIPGNVLPESRQITSPVFLGVGEFDMVGPTHEIPASFPASRDVTLHVIPDTGHSHFLFPSRIELFDRLAAWARTVPVARQDSSNFAR